MHPDDPHVCADERRHSTAALLSLFVPGTGQLLRGRYLVAALLFAIWASGWLIHRADVWLSCHIVGAVHAWVVAARDNAKSPPAP